MGYIFISVCVVVCMCVCVCVCVCVNVCVSLVKFWCISDVDTFEFEHPLNHCSTYLCHIYFQKTKIIQNFKVYLEISILNLSKRKPYCYGK